MPGAHEQGTERTLVTEGGPDPIAGPDAGARLSPPAEMQASQMRDLAALLALPRIWRDRDIDFILGNLLEIIISLLRADAAHVHLTCARDRSSHSAWRPRASAAAESLPATLALGGMNDRRLHVPSFLDDQEAIVIVACNRHGFPSELENFLCRVAVEQAMLAVSASRLVAGLTAANAAKATFLATMSHELRTPLNAIVGYSDLLGAGISGSLNDQQQLHVLRIESAARHLIELIEGILSFARIEAGREQVRLTDVRVEPLMEEVVALIEPTAAAKKLRLTLTCARALPVIRTDESKVRQILLNLLSNAVKFTTAGDIRVVARMRDDVVEWSVADNGTGIAPTDLERIFDPFQQVGDMSRGRAPGTGLGLTVSRQLARLLGGDLSVTSALGAGSTFTLVLPVHAAGD